MLMQEELRAEASPSVGKIVYAPESMTVLKTEEACKMLKISKASLYKKVRAGDIPAYVWGQNYKYLRGRDPKNYKASDQDRTEPMVFFLSDIQDYLRLHPDIADEAHRLDEDDLAYLREQVQEDWLAHETVSYKRVLRRTTRRMQKHYTVLIPAILQIVEQEHWSLEEREDIDHIVEKGRELLARHGYVQRTALFDYMLTIHKKNTRFYPVVAYVARRESWPLESPALEKTQQMRLDGHVNRHRPRSFNPHKKRASS